MILVRISFNFSKEMNMNLNICRHWAKFIKYAAWRKETAKNYGKGPNTVVRTNVWYFWANLVELLSRSRITEDHNGGWFLIVLFIWTLRKIWRKILNLSSKDFWWIFYLKSWLHCLIVFTPSSQSFEFQKVFPQKFYWTFFVW